MPYHLATSPEEGWTGYNNRLSQQFATIGDGHRISALRAGDGIRTHDLLLGKETYYHCTTPACAETQDRTVDTAIFSRVLYQLSYLGVQAHQ